MAVVSDNPMAPSDSIALLMFLVPCSLLDAQWHIWKILHPYMSYKLVLLRLWGNPQIDFSQGQGKSELSDCFAGCYFVLWLFFFFLVIPSSKPLLGGTFINPDDREPGRQSNTLSIGLISFGSSVEWHAADPWIDIYRAFVMVSGAGMWNSTMVSVRIPHMHALPTRKGH